VQQVGHEPQVLRAGQQVVDRGELAGQGDRGAHGVRFAMQVVPRDAGLPAVGGGEGGQDVDGGRLARPVRAEQGEDRPFRHGQVEAVEHDLGAEGLAQARDRDGRGVADGHGGCSSVKAQDRRMTMSP
jgi:hypothetical protein